MAPLIPITNRANQPPKPAPKPLPYASRLALHKWSITKPTPTDPTIPRTWDFIRSGAGNDLKPLTTAQKYEQLARKQHNEKKWKGTAVSEEWMASLRAEMENGPEELEDQEAEEEDADEEEEGLFVSEEPAKKKRKAPTTKSKPRPKEVKPAPRKLNTAGVLFRPTRRAMAMRGNWNQTALAFPNVRGNKGKHAKKTKPDPRLHILAMPEDMREKIWRLGVVDTSLWVDIASAEGGEQPDLAMTCTQIREECLAIFYGENTFGIVLGGTGDGTRTLARQDRPTGILALDKWSRRISKGGWFSHIRNWCFIYRGAGAAYEDVDFDQDDFVFSMKRDEESERVVFEVHRSEQCLFPDGSADYEDSGVCQFYEKDWVERAIGKVLDRKDDLASPKMMTKLAGAVLQLKGKLAYVKCIPGSPEPQSPAEPQSPGNFTRETENGMSNDDRMARRGLGGRAPETDEHV